ncbi:hypothetical protein [Sodalis sp. dw_96]|uniref:hypothetical protein n=1 Tax=Sodalis sp. dw_96 TaxID=2719794 RepID=UPI0021023DF1|nr:hypothetical protein [Sodalis sp. dw_96]
MLNAFLASLGRGFGGFFRFFTFSLLLRQPSLMPFFFQAIPFFPLPFRFNTPPLCFLPFCFFLSLPRSFSGFAISPFR